MKTARKALMLILCAALLVSATVMGTLAYLTSQDAVTNTFTVGKVAITLDEKDVDNSTADAARDKANAYHLLPGSNHVKDPTVHVVANSEDSYIFVKVENEIAQIEAAGATKGIIANQITANGWTKLTDVDNVYYKTYTKNANQVDLVVFEEFNIKGDVTNTALDAYQGKTIKVTAYAIQKAGFADAKAAWTAGKFA